MGKAKYGLRAVALASVVAMSLAACGGGSSNGGSTGSSGSGDKPVKGGTLTFLTVQDQLDKYPSDIFSRVEVADGRAWMLPNGTEFFAGDLSDKDQKLVWATHYAPVFDLFHQQKLGPNDIAWKSKPSWYVLATEDHTVHPDLQRWVSQRMGATVTEVTSSHVPMLSQPDVVIDVIRKAAESLSQQTMRTEPVLTA